MGCSEMPDYNKPLACPICEREPIHTMWEGKYKPTIHRFSCRRCGKAASGYSKEKACERWNKMVLQDLWLYGERKDE